MRGAYFILRSAVLWLLSGIHFFIFAPLLVVLALFRDPLKHDWTQRVFCRTIALLSGARVVVRRAPGFDPNRTSFFIVNHVNLFDPFMLYCAIPQIVRGWEFESHFKIPTYGWLMKRVGNVPVPDMHRPSDLKRMLGLTREAIERGVSLIVFPEATRTRNGSVGRFHDGGFRVAAQLGVPIVPVSLVGSFRHHRTGGWMLWPATITVHIHDTIETAGLSREEILALRDRVHEIVARPVEADRKAHPEA